MTDIEKLEEINGGRCENCENCKKYRQMIKLNSSCAKIRTSLNARILELLLSRDLYRIYNDQSSKESKTYSVIYHVGGVRHFKGIFSTLENAKKYSIQNGLEELESESISSKIDKELDVDDLLEWHKNLNLEKLANNMANDLEKNIQKYHELAILDTIDCTKNIYTMYDNHYTIFGLETFVTNNIDEAKNYEKKKYGSFRLVEVNVECEYDEYQPGL